jgi:uracil-DNA glycosylase
MINKFECDYPCDDIKRDIIHPEVELNPEKIEMVIVSECPIENKDDYFYKSNSGLFFKNTKIIFQEAGFTVNNFDDLLKMGVYLTTAIKCRKTQYLVSAKTIKECSLRYLKREIDLFPNLKVILCMGDFAIKAINYIFKERCNDRAIKGGSTYKIRNEEHIFDQIRFFPSYTHTGNSFNIEKSKRKMIVDDIRNAFNFLGK